MTTPFVAAIALGFALITLILHKVFRARRFVKYLPAVLAALYGAYSLYMAKFGNNEGFQDLAHFIMALLSFAGFITVLLTACFLDYVWPLIKNKS